jgi:hypothetical protein
MKIDACHILTAQAALITSRRTQILILIIKLKLLDHFIPQPIKIYIIDTKVQIPKLLLLKIQVLILTIVTQPKYLNSFSQKNKILIPS